MRSPDRQHRLGFADPASYSHHYTEDGECNLASRIEGLGLGLIEVDFTYLPVSVMVTHAVRLFKKSDSINMLQFLS